MISTAKRLAIDCDGVLSDFTGYFQDRLKLTDPVTKYDWSNYGLAVQARLSAELAKSDDWVLELQPRRGGGIIVEAAVAAGFEVICTTTMRRAYQGARAAWISKHYPEISQVAFCTDPYQKWMLIKQLGCEVAIDDSPAVAETVIRNCPEVRMLVVAHPYNEGILDREIAEILTSLGS